MFTWQLDRGRRPQNKTRDPPARGVSSDGLKHHVNQKPVILRLRLVFLQEQAEREAHASGNNVFDNEKMKELLLGEGTGAQVETGIQIIYWSESVTS